MVNPVCQLSLRLNAETHQFLKEQSNKIDFSSVPKLIQKIVNDWVKTKKEEEAKNV